MPCPMSMSFARFMLILILLASQAGGAGAQEKPTILVWGDSLSAGYGLKAEEAWPSLLQTRLRERQFPHRVANASLSGETSAGGRARLADALARHRPAVVILALGANDGLRGLPLKQMRENLAAMIAASQAAGARVLLAGMQMPPNYGPAYTRAFAQSYQELAQAHRTALVPFLLEGFAADPAQFQADGIHPLAQAQPRIVDTVWPALEPLLRHPR